MSQYLRQIQRKNNDAEVADTWDIQFFGAWSIGTEHKFGEGNVYNVQESTDNGKTWHKRQK